ncbi:MAG: hypothetical protein VXA41_01545 [Euryarchaeota archaeon]
MDENVKIPGVDAPVEQRLLFLQENMVNFVKQYNLPIIEVSLVVSKYIRVLLQSLERAASANGEELPRNISQAWEIDADLNAPTIDSFPLDKLLGTLDEDRMDILDTMMRVIINGAEIPFSSTLTLLRDWEMRLRIQMAEARSPGHLFSPMELPEGF